ncbi:MAG: bifunctional diaminohydroxyphosphoribosylaminopyrimidine deaminase/5-amino-6-(5-phosphoribosylamino)uracil reductase RibD [Victivallales bacterium]|nr:bifunctional diaminohydroxyphosphoribosylaminopyrimidine deaminase/5-amino-6-(5-phosphoribosylamino)uracil reductase RibD [Victivallales bacterium]
MKQADKEYMRQALALAQLAWGRTSPNPMVGAVLVRDGVVIGRGYHHRAGTPHAEINALADGSGSSAGATLYVTLEPCSTYGRTPPCTEAIIHAGIARVVIGCLDPNPHHAGQGVAILRRAGIAVTCPVLEEECAALNEAFFKWITTGMPFVLLKMAMTLDGRIATVAGDSQWVTGPEARDEVQRLRQWADAVMVGGETVRRDHPALTVRRVPDWEVQPRRIVVSRQLTPEAAAALLQPGLFPEVIAPADAAAWREEMVRLGKSGVTAVLVEGGGELAGTLLQAGMVDKVDFFIAPKILGGRNSRPVVGGENPLRLADALALHRVKMVMAGADFRITGYLKG